MEVIIRENQDAGCILGAKIIARVVRDKPDAVLGLATGRTPLRLYQELIREHFERCLDLYLCPRVLKKRVNVSDPSQLIPELP